MAKLEKEAIDYARERLSNDDYPFYNDEYELMLAFEAGAEWRQNNLWKPADGDDLPEIDKPVIVLTQPYPLEGNEYAVSFAHRVMEGEFVTKDGVNFHIESYGKAGWNQPDVVFWLDMELPKKEL